MSVAEISLAVTLGVLFVSGIVFIVRIEGRQNTHERECAERQKRLDERHNAYLATMDRMERRSESIERKIDDGLLTVVKSTVRE